MVLKVEQIHFRRTARMQSQVIPRTLILPQVIQALFFSDPSCTLTKIKEDRKVGGVWGTAGGRHPALCLARRCTWLYWRSGFSSSVNSMKEEHRSQRVYKKERTGQGMSVTKVLSSGSALLTSSTL